MAKKDAKTEKSLLEKAQGHQVKRQSKKPISPEELDVYVAYVNGKIDTSQACFALGVTPSTFRGQSGAVIREAIMQERLAEIETLED